MLQRMEGTPPQLQAESFNEALVDAPVEVFEFGPKNVAPVPYSLINELPQQIRKTYEPAQIDDLATAMEITSDSSTDVQFDMYNPLLCARLSPIETEQYLKEYSAFYGITVDPSTLKADESGNYTLLISGHRRKRAIWQLAQKHELDISHIQVQANLRQGIGFEEALVAQVRENTYEKVPPAETAKQIEQFYTYLLSRRSKKPTHKEVAAKLGQSEGIVSTALRFCSLPEEIQELAHNKTLPYSILVKLDKIHEKRKEFYEKEQERGHPFSETIDEYCLHHLHLMVTRILRTRLEKDEKIDQLIKQEVTTLDQRMKYQQDELELLSPEERSARQRLSRSASLLCKQSLSSLAYALDINPSALGPDELTHLERLAAEARAQAQSTAQQQDGLPF